MSDEADPERWSAGGGPPGTADLVSSIERPGAILPELRTDLRGRLSRRLRPPASRWIGAATVAIAVVLGGLVVWSFRHDEPVAIAPEERLPPEAPIEPTPVLVLGAGSPDAGRIEIVSVIETPAAPVAPDDEPLPPEEEPAVPPAVGWLFVNSTPWSEVFLDGHALGATPVMRATVPAGPHTLRFELERGARVVTEEIEIVVGETLRVTRDLSGAELVLVDPVPEGSSSGGSSGGSSGPSGAAAAGTGSLTVVSIPWARVFVDGRDTGRNTPVTGMMLSAGSHTLGLQTADGEMHTFGVTIVAGETTRISRAL